MEHLDRVPGDANLDLGADQRVWNRVEKVMDLDVIIEIDPRAPPFRELPILGRQPSWLISRYSSQRIIIVTPGRFNSRAKVAQSGSIRRRWPVSFSACPNSRSFR